MRALNKKEKPQKVMQKQPEEWQLQITGCIAEKLKRVSLNGTDF